MQCYDCGSTSWKCTECKGTDYVDNDDDESEERKCEFCEETVNQYDDSISLCRDCKNICPKCQNHDILCMDDIDQCPKCENCECTKEECYFCTNKVEKHDDNVKCIYCACFDDPNAKACVCDESKEIKEHKCNFYYVCQDCSVGTASAADKLDFVLEFLKSKGMELTQEEITTGALIIKKKKRNENENQQIQ